MNVALQRQWTVESFLSWVVHQEKRYEFDGNEPVAVTGGSARHNRVTLNLYRALDAALAGSPWSYYGPDLGIRIPENTVRSPDALITRAQFPDTALLAPDPVIVFEVLSPDSGRRDRIEKVREYASVPSIRRYVIIETVTSGLLVLHRAGERDPWLLAALTAEDMLGLPEADAEIAVAQLYVDIVFENPTPV